MTRIACLSLAGVLTLSGVVADEVPVSGGVGAFPGGVIPEWAVRQSAPVVPSGEAEFYTSGVEALDCPPIFELDLPDPRIAHRFDEERRVTEIYVRDPQNNQMLRYDVDSTLAYTVTVLPVEPGIALLVEDLDLDGEIELVTQYGDELRIHSAPDWTLRKQFVFPGLIITMSPVAVNIDDDPYWELYATPGGFLGPGRAVIIDYDTATAEFYKRADILAPFGAYGPPAVGDFDNDGRTEFISGNNSFGYELFEWQETTLVYIGHVGDSIPGGNAASAVACRPKPGGVLHALLGRAPAAGNFERSFQLLEPTGDNTFATAHVFREYTGWTGSHPCHAADTDCDGLDELVMDFHPVERVWEWDTGLGSFVERCNWDATAYGAMGRWRGIDLDRDGAEEWGAMTGEERGAMTEGGNIFRTFADPECTHCDSVGHCVPPEPGCFCACHADPECDDEINVLDVVRVVDAAFREASPLQDPGPNCPRARTDVDCDGITNVFDVVRIVNVAFRNENPAANFCEPCL